MKNSFLIVSEVFYSIQGEGQCSGYPAVFLRLAGCNLLCESENWRCDTIEVWKHGVKKKFHEILSEEYVKRLKEGAHLVITGGEPLLQQYGIIYFIDWIIKTYGFCPDMEVETNGTIVPEGTLLHLVKFWNVSFKLSNSGEPYKRRVNEDAIAVFNRSYKTTFKIVIAHESDVIELVNDFPGIDFKKVILMPAGDTRDLLNAMRPIVVELCKQMGFRYCDRLHIVIWNQKTGV